LLSALIERLLTVKLLDYKKIFGDYNHTSVIFQPIKTSEKMTALCQIKQKVRSTLIIFIN
jgi:hypothetical protein